MAFAVLCPRIVASPLNLPAPLTVRVFQPMCNCRPSGSCSPSPLPSPQGGRGRNAAMCRFWILFLLLALLPILARAQSSVIISEFLAHNTSGLVDEDGDFSDWIELYNGGATAVNLGGWYLTDDPANLTKWAFSSTNIAAKGFLVVFASGKD